MSSINMLQDSNMNYLTKRALEARGFYYLMQLEKVGADWIARGIYDSEGTPEDMFRVVIKKASSETEARNCFFTDEVQ